MYVLVKNTRQQKEFQATWETVCRKQNWYNDPYAIDGVRYILFHPLKKVFVRKRVIGTIEFLPYNPNNPFSTVEGPGKFEFSKIEEIQHNINRTWEIDKLCLGEAYQRQGYFKNFILVFYDHIIKYQPKYYIGLMEKKFFRMIRMVFGIAIEQPGQELKGPTTSLVPIILDIEKLITNKKRVEMILRMIDTTNGINQSSFYQLEQSYKDY